MSAGRVHAQASVLLAGGFFVGTLFTRDVTDIEYAIGALIGTILTPDLDVDKGFIGDEYIRRRFGQIAYRIWRGGWHFYRRSVKHGSELSHFPVLGTVFRLVYIFLFAVILPMVVVNFFTPVNFQSEITWWVWQTLPRWKIIVGLMASDFHHYCMDIATTNDKFNLGSLLARKTNYKRR